MSNFDRCDWAVYDDLGRVIGWFRYPFHAEEFIEKVLPAEAHDRFRVLHRNEIEMKVTEKE